MIEKLIVKQTVKEDSCPLEGLRFNVGKESIKKRDKFVIVFDDKLCNLKSQYNL